MGRGPSKTLTALLMAAGALAGCTDPLSMTSYAFDGFSYATEGKSVSDMAISQVSDRDCVLWRVIKDKPVCRNYTLQERRDMAVARMEADRYDRRANRVNEPNLYVPAKEPSPILVAQAQEAQARLDAAQDNAANRVDVASSGNGAGANGAGVSSASGKSGSVATLQPAVYTRPPTPNVGANADGVYLVLGSYSSREHAEAARSHYPSEATGVDSFATGGRAIYRVISGPYAPDELAKVKARLAQSYGIRDAWTLHGCAPEIAPACAPSISPTPGTAPVVAQLAALSSIE